MCLNLHCTDPFNSLLCYGRAFHILVGADFVGHFHSLPPSDRRFIRDGRLSRHAFIITQINHGACKGQQLHFLNEKPYQLLTSKLLKQGFTRNRLIATFKKFYGRHSVLVDRFKVSVTNIIIDLFLETLYHR